MNNPTPTAVTIAASDSGGGAGVQADLKTFHAHGVYGTCVVTAITAQNTVRISGLSEISVTTIGDQMEAVVKDFKVTAAKTGVLFSQNTAEAVAMMLQDYPVPNLVVDPVMVSSTGQMLLEGDPIEAFRGLLTIARIVTPNLEEATRLSGVQIKSLDDMKRAAEEINGVGGSSVLIKGGHADFAPATDLLLDDDGFSVFEPESVSDKTPHGTGCTFSAAITARLARGETLRDAVTGAKKFVSRAIESAVDVGKGDGPTNPFYFLDPGNIP